MILVLGISLESIADALITVYLLMVTTVSRHRTQPVDVSLVLLSVDVSARYNNILFSMWTHTCCTLIWLSAERHRIPKGAECWL